MSFLIMLAKRISYGLTLLLAVLVFGFFLLHLAPGDPADVIAGEMGGATEEMMAQIRADYGLDRPLIVQLGSYIGKVAQGDLGYSYYFNEPVSGLILDRLGPTILLVASSLFLAILVGTLLGVMAARKPNGLLSHAVTVVALIGYALPVFWTGIMLVILAGLSVPSVSSLRHAQCDERRLGFCICARRFASPRFTRAESVNDLSRVLQPTLQSQHARCAGC